MRYALVTTKEVPDGGGQRASGILYLETVAEPLDWPGQGFKEYRCDPSTGLTFDPSVVSHTCLYLPACIFPSLVRVLYLQPRICRVPNTLPSIVPSIRGPFSWTCILAS